MTHHSRLLSAVCLMAISCLAFVLATPASAQSSSPKPFQSSRQMIVVTTPDWNAVSGTLQRFERTGPGKSWKPVGTPITIVVGKKGMGWGAGLEATDAPGLRSGDDPVKREGDGKSPAGVFRLSSVFGYAAHAPSSWKMPYIPVTASVECVDDAASKFYNRIVDRSTVSPDWFSSERMAEAGTAYVWGAVIDHNTSPSVPSAGSCVFMHIWGGPGAGTAGCTAMPQEQLEPILAWLNPSDHPILVQMPEAQYKKLETPWRLPSLPNS